MNLLKVDGMAFDGERIDSRVAENSFVAVKIEEAKAKMPSRCFLPAIRTNACSV